jgi:hypothetical protein
MQTDGVGEDKADEAELRVETLSSVEEEDRVSDVEDGDGTIEDDTTSRLEDAADIEGGSTNDELVRTEMVGPAGPVVHVEVTDDATLDEGNIGELAGVGDLLVGDSALQMPKPD